MILKIVQHGDRPEVKVVVDDNYDFTALDEKMNDQSRLTVSIGQSLFHRGAILSVTKEG